MEKINILKIICTILSTAIIYIVTNLSIITKHEQMSIVNCFIHNQGQVCLFGVICGIVMIFLGIVQVIFITLDKYESIKLYNIILLILGILFSFMNNYVLIRIFPAFILQIIIILL